MPKNQNFPITDTRMTRFLISIEDAVKLVWHAAKDMLGGEIYVKKSINQIIDLQNYDPIEKLKL